MHRLRTTHRRATGCAAQRSGTAAPGGCVGARIFSLAKQPGHAAHASAARATAASRARCCCRRCTRSRTRRARGAWRAWRCCGAWASARPAARPTCRPASAACSGTATERCCTRCPPGALRGPWRPRCARRRARVAQPLLRHTCTPAQAYISCLMPRDTSAEPVPVRLRSAPHSQVYVPSADAVPAMRRALQDGAWPAGGRGRRAICAAGGAGRGRAGRRAAVRRGRRRCGMAQGLLRASPCPPAAPAAPPHIGAHAPGRPRVIMHLPRLAVRLCLHMHLAYRPRHVWACICVCEDPRPARCRWRRRPCRPASRWRPPRRCSSSARPCARCDSRLRAARPRGRSSPARSCLWPGARRAPPASVAEGRALALPGWASSGTARLRRRRNRAGLPICGGWQRRRPSARWTLRPLCSAFAPRCCAASAAATDGPGSQWRRCACCSSVKTHRAASAPCAGAPMHHRRAGHSVQRCTFAR